MFPTGFFTPVFFPPNYFPRQTAPVSATGKGKGIGKKRNLVAEAVVMMMVQRSLLDGQRRGRTVGEEFADKITRAKVEYEAEEHYQREQLRSNAYAVVLSEL